MKPSFLAAALTAGVAALLGSTACTTDAFCFTDCAGSTQGDGGTATDADLADVDLNLDANSGDACIGLFCGQDSGMTGDACVATGEEICDGIDNDCDGAIDNGIDFTRPQNCGDCDTNCTQTVQNVAIPVCNPPDPADGTSPGTCDYTDCAQDFYDIDGNRENGCEYFCPFNPTGANTTDPGGVDGCGQDDDCDGEIDEDVGTCDDVENCGRCGKRCVIPNGTAQCVTTAGPSEACTEANTSCEVDQCDIGFADVDGSADNGCEYQCPVFPTTDEICDGLDNDCDGRIDNFDSDLPTTDPDVGDSCFGGTQG